MDNGCRDVRVFYGRMACDILPEAEFVVAKVHLRANRGCLVKWASIVWRQREFWAIHAQWRPIGDFPRVELMVTSKCHDVRRGMVDCDVILRIILWQVVVKLWRRTDSMDSNWIFWR